jgi:hypothetical protein
MIITSSDKIEDKMQENITTFTKVHNAFKEGKDMCGYV